MVGLDSSRLKLTALSFGLAAILVAAYPAEDRSASSPGLISVTVLVTDAQTGSPVNQAHLTLVFRAKDALNRTKSVSFSGKTNPQGRYKFLYVPEGTVQLLATDDHHQTFGKEFEVSRDHSELDIKLKPPQPLL
jgi:hypothetical protein